MAFNKKSIEEIYENMAGDTNRLIGEFAEFKKESIINSIYESFAKELGEFYEELDKVYKSGFIDTAQDTDLDKLSAILGIERNMPDYAEGYVTFSRDKGIDDEIVIPEETLVTTEENENEDPPLKEYITTEEGYLKQGEESVKIPIRAKEAGKDMTTSENTIIVMPLPVPGVKTVNNNEPIRFLGKERETDAEFVNRIKKTLIASGRACGAAIEAELLKIPGIKEAAAREDFVYTNKWTDESLNILEKKNRNMPAGKRIPYVNSDKFKNFKEALKDPLINKDFMDSEKYESAYKEDILPNLFKKLEIKQNKDINDMIFSVMKNPDYLGAGAIEVYANGLNDKNRKEAEASVEKVISAGIKAVLKPAEHIYTDALLKIRINEEALENRLDIEEEAEAAIINFIDELKMGERFFISQMTGAVLGVENIEDIEEFEISACKKNEVFPITKGEDKENEVRVWQKFVPGVVRAVSELKDFTVYVEVITAFPNEIMQKELFESITAAIANADIRKEDVLKTDINEIITDKDAQNAVRADEIREKIAEFFAVADSGAEFLKKDIKVSLDKEMSGVLTDAVNTYFENGGERLSAAKESELEDKLKEAIDTAFLNPNDIKELIKETITKKLETFAKEIIEKFPSEELIQILQKETIRVFGGLILKKSNEIGQISKLIAEKKAGAAASGKTYDPNNEDEKNLKKKSEELERINQLNNDSENLAKKIEKKIKEKSEKAIMNITNLDASLKDKTKSSDYYDIDVRLSADFWETEKAAFLSEIKPAFIEKLVPYIKIKEK